MENHDTKSPFANSLSPEKWEQCKVLMGISPLGIILKRWPQSCYNVQFMIVKCKLHIINCTKKNW